MKKQPQNDPKTTKKQKTNKTTKNDQKRLKTTENGRKRPKIQKIFDVSKLSTFDTKTSEIFSATARQPWGAAAAPRPRRGRAKKSRK